MFFVAQDGAKFLFKYSLSKLYRSVKGQLLLKRYVSSDRNRFSPLSLSPSFIAIKFKPPIAIISVWVARRDT